jgi:hypothetical protein
LYKGTGGVARRDVYKTDKSSARVSYRQVYVPQVPESGTETTSLSGISTDNSRVYGGNKAVY